MKDKTLDMKVVIHCGEDSPRYIRDFQELRAEHIGRKLRSCPAETLRIVRDSLIPGIGTFAAGRTPGVSCA